MLLRGRKRQTFTSCQNRCRRRGLILYSLGLEGVHLRDQVADVSTPRLLVVAGLSPLMGQLALGVMEHSSDSAGRVAKRVAKRYGGQLVIRI